MMVANAASNVRVTGRGFEPGDIAFCLQWEGNYPRLISGWVVAVNEKTVTLEEADGVLFSARRCAPSQSIHHDPREAIHAELEWLRWFMPHDRVFASEDAVRRAKRASALMELWKSLPGFRQQRTRVAGPTCVAA